MKPFAQKPAADPSDTDHRALRAVLTERPKADHGSPVTCPKCGASLSLCDETDAGDAPSAKPSEE